MSGLLQDRLARVSLLTDERFMRLDWGAGEFFRRIHHVCDRNGQFVLNTPVLRSRLYAADRRVSDRQLETWCAKCESAGLLKLRVHKGLRLYKVLNWDQVLKHTKVLYPCDEEAQGEIDLAPAAVPKQSEAVTPQGKGYEEKSPQPPATAGGGSFLSLPKPARQHRSPARRLKVQQDELADVEAQLREVLRPGGCPYNVDPVGEKKQLYNKLMGRRAVLKTEIEKTKKAFSEEEAA